MKNSTKNWRNIPPMGIIFWLFVSATVTLAQGKTVQRPIADFVKAQGTFCISDGSGGCRLFAPPVANFLGWDGLQEVLPQQGNVPPVRCASVDYAGLANAKIEELSGGTISFGTTISGTITEDPLADGRAQVTVRIHTKNALTWVVSAGDGPHCDFATDPLLFGHRVPDVLAGKDAALGESFLEVKFVNKAPGAPLPDLEQLINKPELGQEFPSFISLTTRADGTLRGNFGVPDGASGRAEVIQKGLNLSPQAHRLSIERINLKAVGQ